MVDLRWPHLASTVLVLALAAPRAQAQSCFKLSGGCGLFPQQCLPGAAGPTFWTDHVTSQTRIDPDSARSSCHAPVAVGPPTCCASSPPASPGPELKNLRALLVASDERTQTETFAIAVDYDAPNFACTNTGDWPPGFTCTNDPLAYGDRLLLFQGASTSPADVLSRAFIYYESGTWTTQITLHCGGSKQVSAQIAYLVAGGRTTTVSTPPITVTAPPCADKRQCPASSAGAASGAGQPVNAGSGDVMASVPLFSLAQAPLPVAFGLTYHSERPRYPGLAGSPLGPGWTHSFAQSLRPVDRAATSLYHLTAEGYDSQYVRQADGSWLAASPGELRGRVVVSSGEYRLTDLDGTVTAFDVATGSWLRTTDRWGNAIQGGYDGAGNLIAVTDTEGRRIDLGYSGGTLTRVMLPGGATWLFAYQRGLLVQIFDPLHTGSRPWRTFGYAADSQSVVRLLAEERDEAGFLLEGHSYDTLDRGISSVSEGGRNLVTFEYGTPADGQTRVTHTIDGVTSQVSVFTLTYGRGRYLPLEILGNCATCAGASGDDQHFSYTPDNHLASKIDGNGHVTSYLYDGNGNVVSKTDAAGTAEERTATYRYNYAPWPSFLTEMDEPSAAKPGAQKVSTYAWNASGPVESFLSATESGFLQPGDGAPTVYIQTSSFDARHRLVATAGPRTDVAQRTVSAYYSDTDANVDRRGRLQSVADPSGNVTTFDDYDDYGTARSAVDPNGVVTVRQTDARGRIVASTWKAVPGVAAEASDDTTTFAFDGRDRMVSSVLPRGNATAYAYEDGTNRLLDTIKLDAGGNQIERHHLTLNAIGGTAMEEDQACATPAPACSSWATKRSESFAYDLHNRLAGVLHPVPAGARTFNRYDPDGLLASTQDENHAAPNTLLTYDALHRLIRVDQALATAPGGIATTRSGYDAMDNLASVTDPNGNTTSYRYDDFHRLARQDSPVTGTTLYQYDPAGNLVSTTDARGAVTAKTYDASNRLLRSVAQIPGAPAETVTYAYDGGAAGSFGKGRLARLTDPSGSTSYSYERRGLLRSESRTILGSSYATAYQYDPNGNRSWITYPSGRQVAYTFDFADRPLSATSGATSFVTSASYLPFGPEAQLVYGNGTTKTMSFDLRYRPVENRLTGSAGPLADYLYSEDPLGNITAIHDALDPAFNRDFAYDDLYRLTGATTGGSLWGAGSYSYDPMGNLTALGLGSARQASFSYQGTLPKLSAVIENGSARAVGYDAAGNETAVGSATSTYSPRNLLAAGDGLAYSYDGRGVRVALAVVASFGTITGTVVDANGQPLAGATVAVTGTATVAVSDAAGTFTLTAPPGLYTLTVAKAGFLPVKTTPFTLVGGGSFPAGTIRLSPAPGQITGTVASLSGTPLAGATVSLAETTDTAFTDVSGTFTLTEPAGSYTVTVAQAGYASQTLPAFALGAGTTHAIGTITLLANPATLSGRVVSSAGGAPIAGATVTATAALGQAARASSAGRSKRPDLAQQSGPTFSTTTDPAGTFSLQVAPGTYSVTITAAGFGSRSTSAVNLGPGASFSFGTLTLDPTGTVTGTVVAAAGGGPIQGATVTVLGTLNATTTDASGAFTLTQSAGTFSLQVSAVGFTSATTAAFTLAPGATLAVGAIQLGRVALAVYVAYADNVRATANFPIPWKGSPNVVFFGNTDGSSPYDAGAIRLDNNTDQAIAVDRVTVDLQRPGPVFDLWGSVLVPAHGAVILTQTQLPNFDTSDFPIVGCGQTPAANDVRVPKVTVTVGGVATDYFDTGHILDTGGSDLGACASNEALGWRLIGTTGIAANGAFRLGPQSGTSPLGSPYTLTATLKDANSQPLANVTVGFEATAGPNQGKSGQGVTNAAGQATFTYAGAFVGADTWRASVANASGGSLVANPVTVTWPGFPGLAISVGYVDNRYAPASPNPWKGAPNTIFIGDNGLYDAGAVRLDNLTASPIAVDRVIVDLQRPDVPHPRLPPPLFDLWGSFTIPAHGSAILTETASDNFDTSDYPLVGCGQSLPPNDPRIPKITVTIGGVAESYLDTAHILDTFGYDRICNTPQEALQWRPIGVLGTRDTGQLALAPAASAQPTDTLYTAMAVVTGPTGEPLANAEVVFTVRGRNNGDFKRFTDAAGVARLTYTSSNHFDVGTDSIYASINNGSVVAGPVTTLWLLNATLALSPRMAASPVGTPYAVTLLATDDTGHPLPNLTAAFQIVSGPNAGPNGVKLGSATTDANGQALVTYTSATPGTDTLTASIAYANGTTLASNSVTATWTSPSTLTLSPLTQSQPVGTSATLTATFLDGNHQPIANQAVTLSILSGPNAGRSAQATTNASGAAAFSYSSLSPGSDLLQASVPLGGGSLLSNAATVVWSAVPTTVTYTGPAAADTADALVLTARLAAATTGQPLAGQTLTFTLGGQTLSRVTDASGVATVSLSSALAPGTVSLSIAFAGSVGYAGSAASVLLGIHRDETGLVYTGPLAVANGQPQPVSAVLTDPQSHAPLAGRTVTFTVSGVSASATTDATGTATATLAIPPTLPTGQAFLQAAFAGGANDLPASTTVPVIVYQPTSFVIWGGNTPGLVLGQRVNFWGKKWFCQVKGGDYKAGSRFQGFAALKTPPTGICEPSARTTGTPRLDTACWTKPNSGKPPATLPAYIGVLVSTSIGKKAKVEGDLAPRLELGGLSTVVSEDDRPECHAEQDERSPKSGIAAGFGATSLSNDMPQEGGDEAGSIIYGNIAATVVLQVAPTPRYGSDPDHPGFGTIAAVIADGAALFPQAAHKAQAATTAVSASFPAAVAPLTGPTPAAQAALAAGTHEFYFYTPELHLLAESELTTAAHPTILNEYIWFNDRPVAQIDLAGTTSWTFTDHLGTPLLQTSQPQGVVWRAEYEPYGRVFALRSPDQHQPLRLPGQEAEQLPLGANGVTERFYNIHRWYEAGTGRYTAADPLGPGGDRNPYDYADARPTIFKDPVGLQADAGNQGDVPPPDCRRCQGREKELHDGLRIVCGKTKDANCRNVLAEYGLLDCFGKRCRTRIPIVCIPKDGSCGGCGGPCNNLSDPQQAIFVQWNGLNNPACGSLANTLAHELGHMCGIGPDVGNAENRKRANRVGEACGGPS